MPLLEPCNTTPELVLPEITLRAAAVVPPRVWPVPPRETPEPALARAVVPAALVPIRLPLMTRLLVSASRAMPLEVLPEIRLPAPATVPPMVTPVAVMARRPWLAFATAAVPPELVQM